MIKTVIAKAELYGVITPGKEYTVDDAISDGLFLVICDDGIKRWVRKDWFESKHLNDAKKTAAEAEALAERERVRDTVSEAVKWLGVKSDKRLMECGEGWRISKVGTMFKSDNFAPNESTKVLEQLRKILRVPEGESIVTHAKVVRALADALIGLQK